MTDGRGEKRQKGKEMGLCSALTFANTPCWEHTLARVLSGALESKRTRKPGALFINIRMETREGWKLFTFHSLLVSLFFFLELVQAFARIINSSTTKKVVHLKAGKEQFQEH